MAIKILVADDDPIFRELVCDIITKEGYIPMQASHGEQALDILFTDNEIDMIILDVMMPKLDGWEVLKEIREYSEVPIIMLTALGDERHEVLGLKKGADDYIAKPFSYEVFVARLNNLLRKVKRARLSILAIGDLTINQAQQLVMLKEKEIELNPKEYSLLLYLARNKDLVLTREMILNNIWGYDFEGDSRTVDTHIKTLRAKLLIGGRYIKTIRGSGYAFRVDENEDNSAKLGIDITDLSFEEARAQIQAARLVKLQEKAAQLGIDITGLSLEDAKAKIQEARAAKKE
ncbi:MAG: response regulator transcription factor [Syntrophomonadaceae bacterium]